MHFFIWFLVFTALAEEKKMIKNKWFFATLTMLVLLVCVGAYLAYINIHLQVKYLEEDKKNRKLFKLLLDSKDLIDSNVRLINDQSEIIEKQKTLLEKSEKLMKDFKEKLSEAQKKELDNYLQEFRKLHPKKVNETEFFRKSFEEDYWREYLYCRK